MSLRNADRSFADGDRRSAANRLSRKRKRDEKSRWQAAPGGTEMETLMSAGSRRHNRKMPAAGIFGQFQTWLGDKPWRSTLGKGLNRLFTLSVTGGTIGCANVYFLIMARALPEHREAVKGRRPASRRRRRP